MCLPAHTIIRVLPGASVLLEAIPRRGLRCVIVSNGVWRDEVDYWDDLRAFRLASWVDAVVSSVDTRWRKPHPRFFAAALEAASRSRSPQPWSTACSIAATAANRPFVDS
jgi:FMN phosphatase YigB (HAD superfamily)